MQDEEPRAHLIHSLFQLALPAPRLLSIEGKRVVSPDDWSRILRKVSVHSAITNLSLFMYGQTSRLVEVLPFLEPLAALTYLE